MVTIQTMNTAKAINPTVSLSEANGAMSDRATEIARADIGGLSTRSIGKTICADFSADGISAMELLAFSKTK
jgi:hypothetical protein